MTYWDKSELTFFAMAFATIILIVGILVAYNIYTGAMNRAQYEHCLLIQDSHPNTTMFCTAPR